MSLNIGIISSSYKAAAPPSGNLLLDTYTGAAAAYSLRKLRTAYSGNCIRVKRSSDNAQIDIGFVNNELDLVTLIAFVGAANGNVLKWYDQSGNSNDAIGDSKIIIAGVLQTINGKPCISTTLSESFAFTNSIASNTNLAVFLTAKGNSVGTTGPIIGSNGAPTVLFGSFSNVESTLVLGAGLNSTYNFVVSTTPYFTTNYKIFNCVVNSSNYYIYQNNTNFGFTLAPYTPNPTSFQFIGRYFNSYSQAVFSELVIYKTDQLANRTGIVNNINTFYTIF